MTAEASDPLTQPRRGPISRAWAILLGVAATAIVLYLTVVPEGLGIWWYSAFGPGAALIVLAVVIRYRLRPARPHLLMAAGLLSMGLGDITWAFLAESGLDPFPSFADVLYLPGVVALAAGFWLRYRVAAGGRALIVETLILTTAGAVVIWEVAIQPILTAATNPLATTFALAYPTLDILLLGIVARLILAAGRRNPAFWMVVLGISGFLISDIAYSTQVLGDGYFAGLIDIGWLAGYALFAASVLHPSAGTPVATSTQAAMRPGWRLAALGGATILGPAFVVAHSLEAGRGELALVAGGAILISSLVVVRLAMALGALRRSLDLRDHLQQELQHQASHDALTALPNRTAFASRLEEAVEARHPVAVLFFDVDDFKAVNDSFGHETGDRLLVSLARRLRTALRPGDLACRLGGDEFAVLLDGVADRAPAERIATRMLEALRAPVEIEDRVVLARASVGIALGHGAPADEIMRNADIAMYLAKSQGKDRLQTFDVTMHSDVLARLRVRSELEQAIGAGQFLLYYQPILDMTSGRLVGTEALLRWQHPERGLVMPDEFIEIAESTGLIVNLGRWVLGEALRTTRAWQEALGRPDLTIAVNASPRQIEHPGFPDDVAVALSETGIRPACVTIEITESALLDTKATTATLRQLKKLGVRLAIDDFGTGYSSLSYVGRLPVDEVKIDRSFVAALGSDTKAAALAASVIRLGETLDLVTVAEGIEDGDQLERLRALGCTLGQGFFLARPMAADRLEAFARRGGEAPLDPAASGGRVRLLDLAAAD